MEFFSIEYAEYFVKSFAGSMGDSNAPQLIVENRAVMIDYAAPRSQDDHSTGGPGDSHRRISESTVAKSDWLCETVSLVHDCFLFLWLGLHFYHLHHCSADVKILPDEINVTAAQGSGRPTQVRFCS